MAKVEPSKVSYFGTVLNLQQPLQKTEKGGKSPFSLALERQKSSNSALSSPEHARLQQLFLETDRQAKSLQHHFSMIQLRRYQQALADFMQQVVEFGLKLDYHNQHFRLNRGKRKRYTLVKVIDEQAHQLAQLLLQKQHAQILILEKVNKIQGLIIDLLS